LSSNAATSVTILIAEDDILTRALFAEILEEKGYEVVLAKDGAEAVDIFTSRQFDLVLLDVKMPHRNGFEVCRIIKGNPDTRLIPVVLISGLINANDRIVALECGADDYLNKPVRKDEFVARIRSLLRMKQFTDDLETAEGVLFSLALSIEAKDPYTEGHCARLSKYSVDLATALGLPEEERSALRKAAVVHDIGKVAVPELILLKPGGLTDEELRVMAQHPIVGERICRPLRSFSSVLPIIRHHHEKMDGSGYPDGLKGEAIPITARIMATVDIYDALTTDRPFRSAMPPEKAFEIMQEEVGKGWLDGKLVEQFRAIMAKT
jgi:putative two-component system response regulator